MNFRDVLVCITPHSPERLNGIARFAREHSWRLMADNRLMRFPAGWRGDGLLVTLRNDPSLIRFAKAVRKRGTPVVDLTVERPDVRVPRVCGDHRAIGVMGAEYFAERHFKNVAWFSTEWSNVHALRCEGFLKSIEWKSSARWVLRELLPEGKCDDLRLVGKSVGALLAAAPKPLAILAYDDVDAVRALDVCRAEGLSVPEEVAVLGIGNDVFLCENQSVPLSSIMHDAERTGYEGAALLEELMNGRTPPATPRLILPKGIVSRSSTEIVAVEDALVQRAVAYIADNIGVPFGASQMANALGVGELKLHRRFKAELGKTITSEITRQRLAKAKLLLRNTNMTVAQIADATGFCTSSYLVNTFRRNIGETPYVWRKSHR